MAAPPDELHDIADPGPLLPGIAIPLWLWIGLATIVAAGLAIIIWQMLRQRTTPPPSDASLYLESRHALERLQESTASRSLAEVATEASLIIRHYLAGSLQEPALYETHEEFELRSDALEQLPTGARQRLAPLLHRLAECKYGPSNTRNDAASELVATCLETLQGIESTRTQAPI